jgi:Uma2 family endonuclease
MFLDRSPCDSAAALGPFDSDERSPPGGIGWWFAADVATELTPGRIVRPDIAGWRRDRVPTLAPLGGRPVLVIPDWTCELLSPNRRHDLVTKVRFYHEARVPHYWVLDPDDRTLVVHRWSEHGYVIALTAGTGETVHAEPFEPIEVTVDRLLGLAPAPR